MRFYFLIILTVLCLVGVGLCQNYVIPADVGNEFKPKLGTYTYSIGWQGIGAANAKVSVGQEGFRYKLSVDVETTLPVDIFYSLRYHGVGELSRISLQPIKMEIDHKENSRHKVTALSYEDGGKIHVSHTKNGQDTEISSFEREFATLDPFTAAFLARGVSWKVGTTKDFFVFNGKSRYVISLECQSLEEFEHNGKTGLVYVISPKVTDLTKKERNKKFREAKIYLTTDSSREILEIDSQVFVGSVSARLVDFEPQGGRGPERLEVAKR